MARTRVREAALVLTALCWALPAAARAPSARPAVVRPAPDRAARTDRLARALGVLQRSRRVFERTEARLCERFPSSRARVRALTVKQREARAAGNLARFEICRALLAQSLESGQTALAAGALWPALQRSLGKAVLDLRKAAALRSTRRRPARDMALGLESAGGRPLLERFADRVGAYDYPDWFAAGLIDRHRDVSLERFQPAFREALGNVVRRQGKIHVNLTGIDASRLLRDRTGATALELQAVLGDPRYRRRVQFHLDGRPLSHAEVLAHPRLGKLGRLMR